MDTGHELNKENCYSMHKIWVNYKAVPSHPNKNRYKTLQTAIMHNIIVSSLLQMLYNSISNRYVQSLYKPT
jgi:hypothetical protein